MNSFLELQPGSHARRAGGLIAGGVVVIALLLILGAVAFTTEWLWFDSLALGSVFITSTVARLALFAGGAVAFLVAFAINVLVARRVARGIDIRPRRAASAAWEDLLGQIGSQMARGARSTWLINLAVLIGGLLLGLVMGLVASGNWLAVLQFLNRAPFGIADPAFGQDVGFYLFVMPILRASEGWLFTAWVLVGLSTVALYAIVLTYEQGANVGLMGFPLPRRIMGHFLCLAAVGFILVAGLHFLDMFDLVRSTRGAAYGASYTDLNAQRPAQLILAAAALLAAGMCLANVFRSSLRLAIAGAGVWAVALVAVGWIFPTVVQNVTVTPNQLDRERPYISATIRFTRQAFGLDGIDERDVSFADAVTAEDLARDQETVRNIRLWDPRPLLDTYRQIQSIRQYYQFDDVDVERYTIDGEYRQVMVAPRELVSDQLPREAQSWVSQQLQYTHGYGVAMSPVNRISQEGLPDFLIQDIPPVGQVDITRPEIYFGQKTDHYVITRTSTPEFDYPSGDKGVFVTRYNGDGGIAVGSIARRLLFAASFQDLNFILNSSFQADSQLLYRRNVVQRAQEIAPFLRLDADPYIVVADGSLYWIQDAYTVSDRYPYSEPYQPPSAKGGQRPRAFNYIRNSVKIVTNAYDGTVRFYVADSSDPLIQTYQRIFPALFVPQAQAPVPIRAHFRYPEGLFLVQAEKYRLFHVQDERVFYLREDQWTIANELFNEKKQPVEPYYVIMKLPGEARAEFVLILPFTPSNRDNMIGWLAARSDQPDYGKMVVYKYPKDKVIYGPFQIETRVDQDATISSQFSLWNQSGSRVIRGNLLTIPIGQSNLYVEPIYLQAMASPLPELKRVVVSTGNRIVMEPTLDAALARLFGAVAPMAPGIGAPSPAGSAPVSTDFSALAAQAQEQFQRAEDALRAVDLATYAEEQRALKDTLNQLVQVSNQ